MSTTQSHFLNSLIKVGLYSKANLEFYALYQSANLQLSQSSPLIAEYYKHDLTFRNYLVTWEEMFIDFDNIFMGSFLRHPRLYY